MTVAVVRAATITLEVAVLLLGLALLWGIAPLLWALSAPRTILTWAIAMLDIRWVPVAVRVVALVLMASLTSAPTSPLASHVDAPEWGVA